MLLLALPFAGVIATEPTNLHADAAACANFCERRPDSLALNSTESYVHVPSVCIFALGSLLSLCFAALHSTRKRRAASSFTGGAGRRAAGSVPSGWFVSAVVLLSLAGCASAASSVEPPHDDEYHAASVGNTSSRAYGSAEVARETRSSVGGAGGAASPEGLVPSPALDRAGRMLQSTTLTCDASTLSYDQAVALGCTSIGGNLLIVQIAATTLSSLSSLTSVAGTLMIYFNGALNSLTGLNSLASVGTLSIVDNDALTDLNGLSSLTSVSGSIDIRENAQLRDTMGLCGARNAVTGTVSITVLGFQHSNLDYCVQNTIFTDKASLQTAATAWCGDSTAAALVYQDIAHWDVSAVTDMSSLFAGCSTMTADLRLWNVASVTNMDVRFPPQVSDTLLLSASTPLRLPLPAADAPCAFVALRVAEHVQRRKRVQQRVAALECRLRNLYAGARWPLFSHRAHRAHVYHLSAPFTPPYAVRVRRHAA